MTTNRVDIIDRSVEKTHIWLNELAAELGAEDRKYAYRVLRAVLHAVRDRLTVDETAQRVSADTEARAATRTWSAFGSGLRRGDWVSALVLRDARIARLHSGGLSE
jgi:hypothetical protein